MEFFFFNALVKLWLYSRKRQTGKNDTKNDENRVKSPKKRLLSAQKNTWYQMSHYSPLLPLFLFLRKVFIWCWECFLCRFFITSCADPIFAFGNNNQSYGFFLFTMFFFSPVYQQYQKLFSERLKLKLLYEDCGIFLHQKIRPIQLQQIYSGGAVSF